MNALTLTTVDNEPRILDTDLGERLGLARPTNIRGLILTSMEELEAYGGLHTANANPGPTGGRPTTAFFLNRQQALLICILSRTERAREVRAEVIRRFDAYEQLVAAVQPAPQLPATYLDALKALVASEEVKEQLAIENKTMSEELNNVTVDEYRALTHRYWSQSTKIRVAHRASSMARSRGITLDKQSRTIRVPGGELKEVSLNVYPRDLLDEACEDLRI
jgi:hypothetical protein